MKGELAAFVDTSVLVYAVCADQPHKQRLARSIVERGFVEGCYATSTQVLVEVYDLLTAFLLAVITQRADVATIPGLQAMIPGTPLIKLLNRPGETAVS